MAQEECYEFIVLNTLTKNVSGKNGELETKIMVREARSRIICWLADITAVQESFSKTGKVSRNNCYIFHKDYRELLVKGSYEKIRDIVFPSAEEKKIGYGINTKLGRK